MILLVGARLLILDIQASKAKKGKKVKDLLDENHRWKKAKKHNCDNPEEIRSKLEAWILIEYGALLYLCLSRRSFLRHLQSQSEEEHRRVYFGSLLRAYQKNIMIL